MIDYRYVHLFGRDSVHKDLVITDGTVTVADGELSIANETYVFRNSDIEGENFGISKALTTTDELEFGSAIASECKFRVHGYLDTALKGKQCNVYMYLDNDVNTLLQLGVYFVVSDELTANRSGRNIIADDVIYLMHITDITEEVNRVWTHKTCRNILLEVASKFGINISGIDNLVNGDFYPIGYAPTGKTVTVGMILRYVCQLNGVFPIVTNDGNLKIIELEKDIKTALYPQISLFPSSDLYPSGSREILRYTYEPRNLHYDNYEVQGITQLTIYNNVKEDGYTYGEMGNRYSVNGNFLTDYTQQWDTYGANLLSAISDIEYRPIDVVFRGSYLFEPGDDLMLQTERDDVYTYAMQIESTGIQSIRTRIIAKGKEIRDVGVDNVNLAFDRYNTRINIISSGLSSLGGEQVTLRQYVDAQDSSLNSSIVALGNVLANDYYDKVTIGILWSTLQDQLTALDDRVKALEGR